MHSTSKPNILTINNLLTNSYLRKPCYLKLAIEVGFLGPFTVLLRVLETYHKGTNMYLFVYGTLKSDGSTNLLSASDFISNVTTDDKFALGFIGTSTPTAYSNAKIAEWMGKLPEKDIEGTTTRQT